MNTTKLRRRAGLFLALTAITAITACKGVGIFAYIAVSDKIDEGLLPAGTSASKIHRLNDFDYFSTGPKLFRRDRTKGGDWVPLGLPAGWTNVQSITASSSRLLLALAHSTGGTVHGGLFSYTENEGFTELKNKGNPLRGTGTSYRAVQLYCPNPAGEVFVNVLKYSGDFGRKSTFAGSSMYRLNNDFGHWNNVEAESGDWASVLEKSYVSSAAWSIDDNYYFTTINPSAKSGLLVEENGITIDPKITLPGTGLTWLPNVGSGRGAFIMSSTTTSGNKFKTYVNPGSMWSKDDTATIDSSYRFESFLDITQTQGGGAHSESDKLVLAGTRSTGRNSSGFGYMEINASKAAPKDWTIRTSRTSFTFADRTNYESGKLVKSSIVGFFLTKDSKGNSYIYASTNANGLWKINADGYQGPTNRPGWSRE